MNKERKERRKRSFSFLLIFLMLVPSLLVMFTGIALAVAPSAPTDPLPANGGYWDYFIQNKTLSCNVTDIDGDPMDVTFYIGSTAIGTNTAVANNTRTYMNIGFTPTNYTTYYWHVRVNDSTTNITGPTWVFKGAAKDPDIIQDGVIDTLDNAQLLADYGIAGSPGWIRADINNDGFVNAFDASALAGVYGTIYSYSLYPPTSALATAINTTAVNISWVKGTGTTVDKTIVRSSSINFSDNPGTGFEGWTFTNGTEIYNGTGTYYINTVAQGSTTYYALWTYNVTEHAYYLPYLSGVIRSITTGYDLPIAPTAVSATPSYTDINITWTKGVGKTPASHTLIYRDDENHTNWTRSQGSLISNTTLSYFSDTNVTFLDVYYYALFSYNSSSHTYSNSTIVSSTMLDSPAETILNFTAVKINCTEIDLSWSTSVADTYYIEVIPDILPSTWVIGDGTFLYNGTALYYNHTSLNPNRRYYYSAWTYNSTYNEYSLDGITSSAKTDVFDGVITLGDGPDSMVEMDDAKWTDKIYPESTPWGTTYYSTWKLAIKAYYDYWDSVTSPADWSDGVYLAGIYLWGGHTKWTMGYTALINLMRRDNTAPYSWYEYWVKNDNIVDGASASKWNDKGTKTGKYPYHAMDPTKTNVIEMKYTNSIRGAITGFGIYIEKDSEIRGYNSYRSTEGSKPYLPFDPRYRPFQYSGYNPDDPYTSSAYPRIHLQINGRTVSCQPRDGSDGQYYNKQQYLYWDLALSDEQIFVDNKPVNISIWFETMSSVNHVFLAQTTGADIDADGYNGYSFSSGTGAMDIYNDAKYSGTEDTARSLNYFMTYDPNLGSPGELGPGDQGTTFTAVDTLIISPATCGMYEQVNIIYLLNSTLTATQLRIYNASNDLVFNKTLAIGSGNIFFTPITYGQFKVNLTRGGIQTTMGVFDVYSQVSHGWIYCDQNPVLKNDLFNVHVYYDIIDYPAIIRLYDENRVEQWTWSLPANRTLKYDFTHQMTSLGKFYIELYQQRPYDEQMVARYTLWVKETEYVPTILFSKTTPRINEAVTITITQNIVGTAFLQAKIWSVTQQKYIKVDNIGEKYIFSYIWTPDKYIGYHDVRMLLIVPYSPIIFLQNNTINILDKLPTDEETSVKPAINIPNLLNMGGNVLGIEDVMFKTILGAILVLFIMLLPLILAWRFKLRFADKILTNPMVYTMTAILGAVLAFAFGLFELWIFVLIFIVAITFMIRAWRGNQQSAGD